MVNTIKLCISRQSIKYIIFSALRTIFYPMGAMWFLLAEIIGSYILVVIYLKAKNWKKSFMIFGSVGYGFVLLCNNYFFLI